MGRSAGEDRIEIREGLYIYVRESPVWQVYFKLKGSNKTTRRSLGTRDQAEAKRLALEAYDQARLRQKSGKPESGISFTKLSDEYVASLPSGKSKTYHTDTIRRHLSPFFTQNVPDFSEIRNADVLDYIQWRRKKLTKAEKEPKAQTLNRENVVLSGLIKFAVSRGYLPKADAPDVKALKTIDARRPNFTADELKTLLKTAKARIEEVTNAATKEQRRLMYDWIGVLAETGLRTAESYALKWSDVHLDNDEPYMHIKQGKTKPRDVVLSDTGAAHLKAIRERLRTFLASHEKKLAGSQPVFALTDRANKSVIPVKSFKTAFNSLIDACGFEDRSDQMQWSPYSLRHTYATTRLEAGTGIYTLAEQMGTSVKMIEKHYGHVITRQQRDELTKTRDGSKPTNADMSVINAKFDQVVGALQKDKAETVADIVRQQILKEHGPYNPHEPGGYEIFEGKVYLRMRELGQGDLYEPPADLPDSLKD